MIVICWHACLDMNCFELLHLLREFVRLALTLLPHNAQILSHPLLYDMETVTTVLLQQPSHG